MRAALLPLAILLLAGCSTTGPRSEASWLVGTWLMMSEDLEFPLACSSGLPIQYDSRGTYHLFDQDGRWRLQGDRLTETAQRLHPTAEPESSSEIGRPYVSRLERQGPDAFRKTFVDGSSELFRRCPEQ